MADQAELQRERIVPLTLVAAEPAPTQPAAGSGGSEPHIIMSPQYPAHGKTRGFMLFIESGTAFPAVAGYGLTIWKRGSTTRRWANLLEADLPADTWLTACDVPPSELYFQIVPDIEGEGTVLVHFEEI